MQLKRCVKCNGRFRDDVGVCPIDGHALETLEDPLIGRTIAGRYCLEERLGQGGMSAVYRARHQVIGRHVALKFLPAAARNDATARQRFLDEARAVNQINHEHIIDITDYGETEDGLVYLVMEYLQGRSLLEDMTTGPLDSGRTCRIALQIAYALARAHELDVVHRDIKPDNVFLLERGDDKDFVKVLDFGIARVLSNPRITAATATVGTPGYMSPEHMRGADVTPASDLYSLGCLIFAMLAGRPLFEGTLQEIMHAQLNEVPPPPSSFVSGISPRLDAIVARLLEKKPEARFRDAHHLAEELEQAMGAQSGRADEGVALAPVREGSADSLAQAKGLEEEWAGRVDLYRELIARAHPRGDEPAWIAQSLELINALIAEVRELRTKLVRASTEEAERDAAVRETRFRIGRALDQLASDHSRLTRDIEALSDELTNAEVALRMRSAALLRHIRSAPGGSPSATVACAWADAKELTMRLGASLEASRRERDDLDFQMAQLKGRLGTLNAESALAREEARLELTKLDARVQLMLERIIPESVRISSHLREFPELRQLLGPSFGDALL